MHLNTHTGRNVHTCPYCNIQFISRQSYESHIKVHGNIAETANPTNGNNPDIRILNPPQNGNGYNGNGNSNKTNQSNPPNAGPQIVCVKSINTFENEAHEEIQIEPDIIEEVDFQVLMLSNKYLRVDFGLSVST